ncbi:unnamed protein product [Lactuca virosa]|uniref:Uncharacterized protein n=1 Tax=Lactuca virosa TaxID=75947 RepID=A0AAU9LX63_9ASTR|nr:unnamed protein product [Lactuca virosa]
MPHGSIRTDVHVPSYGTSQMTFITCIGKKFGRFYVVWEIRRLIDQYIGGPWISFEEIPKEVIEQIWVKFKTLYDWDKRQDEKIKTNFKFVIQEELYRDIRSTYRERSTKMAIAVGHDM